MAESTPTTPTTDSVSDPDVSDAPQLPVHDSLKPCAMKSCLKTPTPPRCASPAQFAGGKKTVAFCDDGTEVYLADEWDRSPAEVAQRLSYQDILELKEIQRSLPKANQPSDPFTNRPSRHYLAKVPIGLLPLLPASPAPQATLPPSSPQSCFAPARITPSKTTFPLLPLLDNTTTTQANTYAATDSMDDSDCDTSTPSLTNASLDSPPPSLSSNSPSPSPDDIDDIILNFDDADVDSSSFDYFDIPPRPSYSSFANRFSSPQTSPYSHIHNHMYNRAKIAAVASPGLQTLSPLTLPSANPKFQRPFLRLAEPVPSPSSIKNDSSLFSIEPQNGIHKADSSNQSEPSRTPSPGRDRNFVFAFERDQAEREGQGIPPSLSRVGKV